MKVTVVGPAYPLRGGISHHVYWLKRGLTERGHEVQVISFSKLYPSLLFPGTTQTDTSRLRLDPNATALLSTLNPLTWVKAFNAIKDFNPRLVIFQWWQPFFSPLVGTLARALARSGFKCLMECHNVFPHEKTAIDSLLLKFAFAPADYFITHSEADRGDLLRLLPAKRAGVSPLPSVEELSAPSDSDRGGRTILFFGKVRKYKGLNVLLEAMPKVLSVLDCRLLIVGEFYDSLEKYREFIIRHDLGRRVTIDNRYVPNEEVSTLFAEADVLVLPYLSATQSGVARIAFTNALPVIASTAGGLSEVVSEGETGLLFPPGDADALARAIIAYFTDNLGPRFAANLRASSVAGGCRIIELIEDAAAG